MLIDCFSRLRATLHIVHDQRSRIIDRIFPFKCIVLSRAVCSTTSLIWFSQVLSCIREKKSDTTKDETHQWISNVVDWEFLECLRFYLWTFNRGKRIYVLPSGQLNLRNSSAFLDFFSSAQMHDSKCTTRQRPCAIQDINYLSDCHLRQNRLHFATIFAMSYE